jgi:predicted transcriptional regulator of viral defense system
MKRQRSVEVLRELPALFRYADAAKFVSNPNVFLTRALKAGYVARIVRGAYYNTFKEAPRVEDVACYLRTPSYISCEWALNYHGVILQVPFVCTVITLSASVGERNKVHYKGTVIEYSKISEKLFHGYEVSDGFNMAIPEKALLDLLYLRGRMPFADEIEPDNLDITKLTDLSKSYPKSVQMNIVALK